MKLYESIKRTLFTGGGPPKGSKRQQEEFEALREEFAAFKESLCLKKQLPCLKSIDNFTKYYCSFV